jgi:hypothetical protein
LESASGQLAHEVLSGEPVDAAIIVALLRLVDRAALDLEFAGVKL